MFHKNTAQEIFGSLEFKTIFLGGHAKKYLWTPGIENNKTMHSKKITAGCYYPKYRLSITYLDQTNEGKKLTKNITNQNTGSSLERYFHFPY